MTIVRYSKKEGRLTFLLFLPIYWFRGGSSERKSKFLGLHLESQVEEVTTCHEHMTPLKIKEVNMIALKYHSK